jgi:hypothetical protein
MNRTRRKLIWLGISIMASILTIVSSTYAFVVLNDEAKVSEIEFEIENQDGLLLSLDGVNYYQDISYEMIVEAIERYVQTTYASNSKLNYSDFNLTGVSMKNSQFVNPDKEIDRRKNVDRNITYKDYLGNKSYRVGFVTDKEILLDEASGDRNHKLVDAQMGSYVAFDVWCKVETNGISTEDLAKYNLYFSQRTSIKGEAQTVNLVNELTSFDYDKIENDKLAIDKYNANLKEDEKAKVFTLSKEHYMNYYTVFEDVYKLDEKTGEKVLDKNGNPIIQSKENTSITVNPANAMRIAVLQHLDVEVPEVKEDEDPIVLDGFDYTSLLVFEPTFGIQGDLGSSAIESSRGVAGKELTDPSLNAMYTYYNNTHPLSPFDKAASDSDQFDTIHSEDMYTTELGSFEYDTESGDYNVVKLTVMIYLDGWDADYFMGINATDLDIRLGFEIKEQE